MDTLISNHVPRSFTSGVCIYEIRLFPASVAGNAGEHPASYAGDADQLFRSDGFNGSSRKSVPEPLFEFVASFNLLANIMKIAKFLIC